MTRPDLALAPDGTLHLAWSGFNRFSYANSLGSFLATNFAPHVSFGAPSGTASAAIVPTAISDADGDALAGHIHVGRVQDVVSLVEPDTTEWIIHQRYALSNDAGNGSIRDAGNQLNFRVMGGDPFWLPHVNRNVIPALPATIETRLPSSDEIVGAFIILAWDDTGVTISQVDFIPYVTRTYSGTLPSEIDISALPDGNSMVAIGAWDGSISGFGARAFTKTSGQTRLLLTEP